MAKQIISVDVLRSVLDYNQDTGSMKWSKYVGPNARIGADAGFVNPKGYVVIGFRGSQFFAHRIAWQMAHGECPEQEIDHINGNRQDNRIENLRLATRRVNCENQRKAHKNNATGLLGVTKERNGTFSSTIRHMGKTIHLGNWDTKHQAHEMYVLAKRRIHEGCTI